MRVRPWVVGVCLALLAPVGAEGADRPDIVVILADDLGLGDVRCFNPAGKIPTPHLDRMASEGMRFPDAHSGSALCTPTRYGLLTGRYSWRSTLRSGVLNGYSKRLIEPDRLTLPALLRQNGYRTACVGKWHLGMDWATKPDAPRKVTTGWEVDYGKPISDGPVAVGFDRFRGISASLDMPPYVFIENDRATVVPTTEKTWIRKGPAAADFEAIDVLPDIVRTATAILEEKSDAPLFLYLPLAAPHTPIVPTAPWQGKTGLNAYGDFVAQVDDAVGQILAAVERSGRGRDTLVLFTSDNGFAPMANLDELREKGHDPCAGRRGTKADIFEGGHRIPLLVRWPGRVAPGSTSDQVACLTDVFATCAGATGIAVPETAAEDSVSLLPALRGTATGPLREATVHQSSNGSLAIRQGRWKLALCPDSGGWSTPRPGRDSVAGLPADQLYDLDADPAEQRNVEADHPDVVARLTALLERYVADGRSTPGPARPNTGPPVRIRQPVQPEGKAAR